MTDHRQRGKKQKRAKRKESNSNYTPHNYEPITPAACALALLNLVSTGPLRALVGAGRLDVGSLFLELTVPTLELFTIPFAEGVFALLAAATALNILPALGLFLGSAPVALTLDTAEEAVAAEDDIAEEADDEDCDVGANFSRSIFFRKGEGRFASSFKSYFGGDAGVEADRLACGRPLAWVLDIVCVCELEDDDAAEDDEAVWALLAEVRPGFSVLLPRLGLPPTLIDGLLNLVAGIVLFSDLSFSRSLSLSCSSLSFSRCSRSRSFSFSRSLSLSRSLSRCSLSLSLSRAAEAWL